MVVPQRGFTMSVSGDRAKAHRNSIKKFGKINAQGRFTAARDLRSIRAFQKDRNARRGK